MIRKNIRPTLIVRLNGGLGNQLFQYSSVLGYLYPFDLILEYEVFSKYVTPNPPEITKLILPITPTQIHATRQSYVNNLCNNAILKSISYPNHRFLSFVHQLAILILSITKSMEYGKFMRVVTQRSLGDLPNLRKNSNLYFVGYFQSNRIPNMSRMMSIKPLRPSEELSTKIQQAISKKPLFIQVRCGDYEESSNDDLGSLDSSFFESAYKAAIKFEKYSDIWIFTDDEIRARQILSFLSADQIKYLSEVNNSISETLELLRYGQGYIISNSTFGWWGAKLAYNLDVRVIAPHPWFRKVSQPDFQNNDWEWVSRELHKERGPTNG